MRLRIVTPTKTVHDSKVPKADRQRLLDGVRQFELRRDSWEYEQIALEWGEIKVTGMLKGIESVNENGEEIIVFRFWEI